VRQQAPAPERIEAAARAGLRVVVFAIARVLHEALGGVRDQRGECPAAVAPQAPVDHVVRGYLAIFHDLCYNAAAITPILSGQGERG